MNVNKIMNYLIDDAVIDFFENNRELLYLCNERDDICETPIVGYNYSKVREDIILVITSKKELREFVFRCLLLFL